MNKKIEELLKLVQKPARYAGGELNSIVKPDASFRMAISYPDLYEVGMSNNGIRILYDRINSHSDYACERVFAVEKDFEDLLRAENQLLYSLETFTPLKDLDLVGFNVSHELLATNILQILDLGGIPLYRKDRGESDPFVIAGGASVSNPFPLSDFIDLFFIGDGEEGIVDIANEVSEGKKLNLCRADILENLSRIEGVLVSEKYEFDYSEESIEDVRGPVVKKRIFRSAVPVDPEKPVIPSMRITQDRAVVEVTRGCRNLCKFCHAGYYDLPYRVYPEKEVEERLLRIIENTGYNEASFSSLSLSDYRYLADLLNSILPGLTARGISISLPSLRVDRETIPLIESLSDVRKTSLTFAVESASEEIRRKADKKVDTDELLFIMKEIFNKGWRAVKLYFMIGLPGCDETDEAQEIIDLLLKIKSIAGKGREINITVSPFIPKPHTPFENEKQMDMDYFSDVIFRIKRGLPRSINVKNHNVKSSCIEGVFSRADARLGKVIYKSYLDGCRFDSWREHFRYHIWKENLDEILPFWEKWLGQRDSSAPFVWSVVSTGFEKVSEARKSFTREDLMVASIRDNKKALDSNALEKAMEEFSERYNTVSTVRLQFTKKRSARFISHLDFMEVVKRGLRIADLPISYTQGFNKREKISSGFPAPLGIESETELCDVELFSEIDSVDIRAISDSFPDGIDLIKWEIIGKSSSLMALICATEYKIEAENLSDIEYLFEKFSLEPELIKSGKKGEKVVAFSDAVIDFKKTESSLVIILSTGTDSSLRITDVIKQADSDSRLDDRLAIIKTAQFGKNTDGLYLIG